VGETVKPHAPVKRRGGRPRKLPKTLRLDLGSLPGVRESLGAILREYLADDLPETKARTAIYGLRAVADILKLERDQSIETRLDELEAILKSIQDQGGTSWRHLRV
jgi:hypothetical protein